MEVVTFGLVSGRRRSNRDDLKLHPVTKLEVSPNLQPVRRSLGPCLCILKEPMVVPEHRFILHALISEKALDVRLVARGHAPGLLDQGREADRLLTVNQVRKPDHHCPRRRQLHLSLPPRKAISASSRRMSSSPSLQHRGGISSHCPQIEISRPTVLPHTHGAASTVFSSERVSPQSAHRHGRAGPIFFLDWMLAIMATTPRGNRATHDTMGKLEPALPVRELALRRWDTVVVGAG